MSKWKIHVLNSLKYLLGEELVDNFYKKKCIERYRKAGIIFIHIPKAAGTSISNAVIGKRAGHFTTKEIKDFMSKDEFESFFKFSVTRNPYDRLVSAYHYAKQGGGSSGGIEANPVYNSPKFSSFERFVKNWLVDQNIKQLDYVFQPQYKFLFQDDNLLVDYVGKMEEMEAVEKKLSKVLNRKIQIKSKNYSERKADYFDYYDKKTIKIVSRLYEEDIKQLGYSFN